MPRVDEMTYMGRRVIVSDLIRPAPKLRVREDVPMTDAGRTKMNAWLLETFGENEQVLISDTMDCIFMSPNTAARLRYLNGMTL